ncbi:hypothetical protein C1752_03493 [Acaryochloris thomasi RCC1774]|uniref:Uncharacterized protein n=1 Tax=Acaryochloris thomasi RCC1774 TaxID=1764569 RepID=A0A2W1JW50_9CYAN|nr:hypothetical protein C1752_03493 [Acaryochloris thomasi RCC1774]
MDILYKLFSDPRLSIVLAPLVISTFGTLFLLDIFDHQD